MQSCCSPIAYASAAAPRLRTLQLLLPDCVRFSCCSPIASIRFKLHAVPRFRPLQLLPTDCIPSAVARHLRSLQLLFPDFNCSPIASASAAAPRLRPLQLQLPDCVRFNCCSPIASASTAAPRLHPLVASPVLKDSSQCSRTEFEVQYIEVRRSRVTSLVPPHEHPTSVTHGHTHIKILIY